MDCSIKEKTLKDATSEYKTVQVTFDQAGEHKDASKVAIGFAAEAAQGKLCHQRKVSVRQVLEMKMDCKTFLISPLLKLIQKTPVQYPFVRSLQCLDPMKILANKE